MAIEPIFNAQLRKGAFLEIMPVKPIKLGRVCRIQYVPSTWTDSISVNTQNQNVPGTDAPSQQFVHTKPRTIDIKLLYNSYTNNPIIHPINKGTNKAGLGNTSLAFSTIVELARSAGGSTIGKSSAFNSSGNTVEDAINFFMSNCEPSSPATSKNNYGSAPNILRFFWGTSKTFGSFKDRGSELGSTQVGGTSANYIDLVLLSVKVERQMFSAIRDISSTENTSLEKFNSTEEKYKRSIASGTVSRLGKGETDVPESTAGNLETRRAIISLKFRRFKEFPF